MPVKKILHIYSSWTAGGAEKLMLSLAAELQKNGTENIIAAPGDSYLYAKAKELGLKAYPFSIRGSFAPPGLITLWKIIKAENVDILHAHQGKVFWPCIIMKLLFGGKLKVVFHRHAQLPHAFYSRSHYSRADAVIAISKAVADGLIQREKVDPAKVRVIYNGTDFGRFSTTVSGADVRRRYGLEGKLVAGTVAAMNRPKGKGQEYIIEAAQILKTRYPDARYLIVGTGEIEDELKAFAVKMRVSDNIVFTGYQEEVQNFIAAMDVFCFLSWDTEGFGQVMVEAQAMGKPVIGTDIGGIPETLDDSRTGFVIPPRNSEMLAQVLSQLFDDSSMRATMGAAARSFVTENFSNAAMASAVRKLYEEISTPVEER